MSIPKYFELDGKRFSEAEVEPALLTLNDDELLRRNFERDRVWELRNWLLEQSSDTKLLFVLHANWDRFESIIFELLEDPNLDRAIAARIFWASGTFNTEYESKGSASSVVIRNLERGYYQTSELELNRCDLISNVHSYLKHVAPHLGPTSKKLPRQLCGPFTGRSAVASPPIDQSTEESLVDIFDSGSMFPFTYAQHCSETFEFWAEKTGFLKVITELRLNQFSDADDITYLEHIYGGCAAFRLASAKAHEPYLQEFEKRWKPFNTAVKNGWKPKEFWDPDFKPPPFWLTIDRGELRARVRTFLKGAVGLSLLTVLTVGLAFVARRIFKGQW